MSRTRCVDRVYLADAVPVTTGLCLDLAGPPPTGDEVRNRLAERVPALPALGLGVNRSGTRFVPLPPRPGDQLRLLPVAPGEWDQATETLLRLPLAAAGGPLWDLTLLTAPGERRFRLCLRAHHTLLDGVGIAHTALALLADRPVPGPYPARTGRPTATGAAALARTALGSLRRPQWPGFGAERHGDFRWVYADLGEPLLRRAADRHGVTANDVFLAALARAFHICRPDTRPDAPCPDLPLAMPMSVRDGRTRLHPGNHLVFGHFMLPVSAPDARTALARVVRTTARLRACRYRDTVWALYDTAALTPVTSAHLRLSAARAPVSASHVALPEAPVCFGAPVTAAARLPVPAGGARCYAGLTRVAATARLQVVHDTSVPWAARLPALCADTVRALAKPEGHDPASRCPGRTCD
ncbi:hypothetical protein NX801_14805 [Streptomyces sp. LP05-1]|uniref:Diacylglycerol O-acyltransferase n=1 Tax=Streptomyces pyxinae TaxID=2970734 RepID=A0ABT2CHM2_9ACTN|nr:hypothetical protein [Streptomyces sp. LP05-1]MCS0636905.1 hypothetical protein [Streptomyces sp. LP05-1]